MRFAWIRRLLACAAGIGLLPLSAGADTAHDIVANDAEPAISPDHAEIAFATGGDIWSVPAAGGTARLLVATGGVGSRPIFSPDGKHLAFVGSRAGATGIYVVTLDGGTIVRLTHDDATPVLDAWTPDGRALLFSTSVNNIGYAGDIMRVPLAGGTPMRVATERFVNAMDGAPAPDGRGLAYVRNGFLQWWRRGHSHMDQAQIVFAHAGSATVDTLTPGDAKDRWPMWSPDAATLYFVSDRSGSDELWARSRGGALKRLTTLGGQPVLWPTISHDGRTIAFEHGLDIWTYDTSTAVAHRVPIARRGGSDAPSAQHVVQANRFSALDLAPDGKKVAFVARGRIFAASSSDEGPAQLVATGAGAAYDLPVWSHDSRHLAYVVDRGMDQAIAVAELPDPVEQLVTPAGHHDDYPHWSPDGKQLAFVRDGRELHVLDAASHADRIVARGVMDRRPFGDPGNIAFSPAGDWIAYIDVEAGFANVHVVRTGGGETYAVSFLPNGNAGPLSWSTDGSRLFFVTSQRTENGAVAQIDLVPRAPHFGEDKFRSLFDRPPARDASVGASPSSPTPRATAPAAREVKIDVRGIRERVTFLATGLDVSRIATTSDGKKLVLVGDAAGQQNLYAFSIDDTSTEPAVARQLTSTAGPKAGIAVAPDAKSVYYLDAGTVWNAPLDGMKPHRVALSAAFDVDFTREKSIVFAQAWSLLDRWYADPQFHGADWNAVERNYAPHAQAARTPDELRRVISLMLGELNSSHLGISRPRTPGQPRNSTGRLGVQWDTEAYARDGRLRIAEIVPLGPLALAGAVHVGDELVDINGHAVDARTDVDELLDNTIGSRTTLRIAPHGDRAATRTIVVLPVGTPDAQQLLYRSWVSQRRAYVERISGGRLGYVHLFDMGEESLRRFYVDLDVQNRSKAGVVVDIRNNEGGFVDPYAVDVLTRHEYARFASRFGSDPGERTALGQRSLDKPSVLVVNEHSLSDAENFTEAYRVLHGGNVIGVPTAGWIIFTSSAELADGSILRLPSTRVFAHDGVDMELHPRPVDVRIDNPPGSTATDQDPQLAAAVRNLLHTLGNR